MAQITADTLQQLQAFDTPTVCNVIELFDVRPRTAGYMDARIRAGYPSLPPMVGFAATATCRTAHPPPDRDVYHFSAEQIERFGAVSGSPVVVFQDLDDPVRAATFGELMCSTYQAFSAVGLITSGAGRDLEQVQKLNFPVFTSGAICSHGYIHILDLHIPVQVGGLTIFPDDLLHGDVNGVTTIPHTIASEVAEVCAEFVAAEQIVLDAVQADRVTPEQLRAANAEKESRIADLRTRVSRKSS